MILHAPYIFGRFLPGMLSVGQISVCVSLANIPLIYNIESISLSETCTCTMYACASSPT